MKTKMYRKHAIAIAISVALAGGYTYRAKKEDLLLTRANKSKLGEQAATEKTVVEIAKLLS